jgi:hypothetical protein
MDYELEPTWMESPAPEAATAAPDSPDAAPDWSHPGEATTIDVDTALSYFAHYIDPSAWLKRHDGSLAWMGEEEEEPAGVAYTACRGGGETALPRRRRRSKDEPCDCWGCRRTRETSATANKPPR